MRLAAHQVIFRDSKLVGLPYADRQIVIRIINFPVTPLKDVKAGYIDKFVAVRGSVVRVSPIRPIVVRVDFVCMRCNARVRMFFPDGRWQVPKRCYNRECKSTNLVPDKRSAECVDWQRIRLQEIITDYKDTGRIPRTIECELTEELVGSVVPGDIATVTGVAKIMAIDQEQYGGGNLGGSDRGRGGYRGHFGRGRGTNLYQRKVQTLFLLYVYANSVSTSRDVLSSSSPAESLMVGTSSQSSSSSSSSSTFPSKEVSLIRKIILKPNLFDFLCNSLAPNIFGHQIIKKAFILALFGGTQRIGRKFKISGPKDQSSQNASSSSVSGGDVAPSAMPVRSSIHVLIVGDPGMGKSQMLRAVASVTPRYFFELLFLFDAFFFLNRGVYVCGNTSTSSGLTVTVMKEGGDFALEAGMNAIFLLEDVFYI
jgi:DNA helicase MCM8